MKVSTRIVGGFGILLLVLIAALAYQVFQIYNLQAINRSVAQVNFKAAATVQRMEQKLLDLESDCKKFFVLNGEVTYAKNIEEQRMDFASDLASLERTQLTPRERMTLKDLYRAADRFWQTYDDEKAKLPTNPNLDGAETTDSGDELPSAVRDAINEFSDATQALFSAVQIGIQEQGEVAAAAGDTAGKISFIAGGASLLIAIVLAIVIVRAIAEPLRQLTHSTRRISKGQFWHRLPTDGGDEFAELARDFNEMALRLSELDQMKKGFVSHVSHELKAPLASMRQVFLLMLQEIPGRLNDQQRKLLRLSSNSAERLSAMVGNLLDVSRMEAGAMEYTMRPLDLAALAQAVVDEFEVQAQEKNIQLKLESAPEVWAACDRDRVVQVIGNLIDNALKFTPQETAIVVRLQTMDGRKALVSVSDSGPGVPEQHKTKIFEKFHQLSQGKKLHGQSVGLGLAICKSIVEAHRGRIWVEDNPDGGSVFFFDLPASTPTAASASESLSMAGGAGR
jgi:signal transduction histidine kinase